MMTEKTQHGRSIASDPKGGSPSSGAPDWFGDFPQQIGPALACIAQNLFGRVLNLAQGAAQLTAGTQLIPEGTNPTMGTARRHKRIVPAHRRAQAV
jgi:hypothetical protein